MKTFREQIINESENRYVVTIELYMYDKDDKSVIKQAKKLTKDLQKNEDNSAEVTSIVEQKFGTIGNRKII